QVNLMANWFLDQETYKLFKNVTLPTEEDSTQIDHIIVSRFGVFVIEIKNMKGWNLAAQQKNWTQQMLLGVENFPIFDQNGLPTFSR
ncbi:MAG: nuclease-related domain-containing protein, partial [Methylobacter sp.]